MPQPRGTRVRATRQAAAVIAVMSGMRAFYSARDIYAALRRRGQHVGLATVYRHLHVLAERGEVDTIHSARGESRYRLRAGGATCHLTCRACGHVVAVDGTEILDWGKQIAAEAGFTLTRYTVALSGLCSAHGEGQPGGFTPTASTARPKAASKRVTDAFTTQDGQPGPGDEGGGEQAS